MIIHEVHKMFKIKTITLKKKISNRNKIHILFDENTFCPCLYPLIFSFEKIRFQSLSTQYSDLSAIKIWYEFWYFKHNYIFCVFLHEEEWSIRKINKITQELDAFLIYLEEKFKNKENISYIADDESINYAQISRIFSSIKKYFVYFVKKYIKDKNVESDVCEQLNSIIKILNNITQDNPTYINNRFIFKSLNAEMITTLMKVINPSVENLYNPFHNEAIRVRNYLMVRLIYNYGVRVGELMLLTKRSFYPQLDITQNSLLLSKEQKINYSMFIINTEDEGETRNRTPSIKNKESIRIILLDSFDAYVVRKYFSTYRNDNTSNFLFTTLNKGQQRPLSYSSILAIFNIIDSKVKDLIPHCFDEKNYDSIESISPHIIRHTWAYIALANAHSKNLNQKDPQKSAEDELRVIGGWSDDSKMPQYYGRRFIVERANFHNMLRINNEMNGDL